MQTLCPFAGSAGVLSPSSRSPPVRQSRRCSKAAVTIRRSPIGAKAAKKGDDFFEDEELRRRPPGHPLAFGDPSSSPSSSTSTPSSDAPLSWPSLDLASVAAALARSSEGKSNSSSSSSSKLPGGVHLVGTGPGDPGLLTLRAVALLASADVVLYDRLVSPEILALVNPSARMVYVGKSKGLHTRSQEEIHDLLVAFASEEEPLGDDEEEEEEEEGEEEDSEKEKKEKRRRRKHPIVLRLKGGDPLVFGRGGEEATALRAAGIPVRTEPGISAAGGVAASLGIPLTHRGVATSVRLLTGHARPGGERGLEEDVERIARGEWSSSSSSESGGENGGENGGSGERGGVDRENTTLVIYMGLSTLRQTSESLIRGGMRANTPAVAVERGTTERQRAVYSTVEELPDAVEEAALVSPTLIIIGGVVALSPGWQEEFCCGEEDGEETAGAVGAAADLAAAA